MDESQNNLSSQADSADASACGKCAEYLAGWKRAQADYANVLREHEQARTEFVKFANTSLLQSLLPSIDQFALAMRFLPDVTALPDDVRKAWESWLIGIRAVQSMWEQTASSVGLERIKTDGAFDPMVHEAVGHESKEGVPSGSIIRVQQDGWKLHGKVLRPAQVVVAT